MYFGEEDGRGIMNRGALGGLIFAVGLILLLVGAMTDVYSTVVGVIIALAVWLIGGALATLGPWGHRHA